MFTSTFIAMLAAASGISPAAASLLKKNSTPRGMAQRSTAENPAAAFATWSSGDCHDNQADQHVPDGECASLPGKSLQLWWLQDSCRMFAYKNQDCSNTAEFQVQLQTCYDVSEYVRYKVFCH